MSVLDIINIEIERRRKNTQSLIDEEQNIKNTIEQFNKLDEVYRANEKDSRERLENLYKENRHFSGKQPLVYTFTQTEKHPYFGGAADSSCNPYFPASGVQNNTYDGITPLYAPPTKTGTFARDANYAATENVPRTPALAALQAFPDITGEPLPPGWPGAQQINAGVDQCFYGVGGDALTCAANGGTWVLNGALIPDPVWVGANTAPAKLRVPLQAWKTDILAIQADLFEDAGSVEYNYWQGIINDINTVLAAIASDAVFVRATGNPSAAAWGQTQAFTISSAEDTARNNLITAAQTGVPSHVSQRLATLNNKATVEEQNFFNIIKLRLHQANGSYSKLKAAKKQLELQKALIQDNTDAVASLNLLKVKNS